jgi:hypothetical protein
MIFSNYPIAWGEAWSYAKSYSMMGSFFSFPIDTTILYKGPQYDIIHNLVINFEVVSEKK